MTSPRDGLSCDVLVAGSGIAGLVAALRAAPRARVVLVTKSELDDGCSRYAQGGIAAAVRGDDSASLHAADTIAAGRGLCDERAVRVLCEEGPGRVRELVEWGVGFDTQDGELVVGREAAHSRPRILHARGDGTGLEIESSLIRRLRRSGVTVLERHHVTRLLTDRDGRCVGVEAHDHDRGELRLIGAASTILASGGAGRLWEQTTNPEPATGDGVALAFDAGAEIASMEFVQFHPTALALPGAPRFLISEAVRGEGALILDDRGERFLLAADPRGELAPRDVVAQAIWAELRRTGSDHVYLDCSPLAGRAALRFPTIHATCLEHGIDMRHRPIPVAPAAHYMIGGVRTDLWGASSVEGLYACGEVASSGVHGANRLASNSLLESVVFAHRAVEAALDRHAETPPPDPARLGRLAPVSARARRGAVGGGELSRAMRRLRRAMWEGCGLVRNAAGLRRAAGVAEDLLESARGDASLEGVRLRGAATTASLVATLALAREESRGAHQRSDHPATLEGGTVIWTVRKNRGARGDSYARTGH